MAMVDEVGLVKVVAEVLNRRPVAGLAVAVVQGKHRGLVSCPRLGGCQRGVCVDEDTVLRIGSIAKTMTAISVMQLVERGLFDLSPVGRYLRSFRLRPADGRFGPVTVRHLLTHTGGVRAVRTATDLIRRRWAGARVPTAPCQRWPSTTGPGWRLDVQPGTRFAYSNNGFAVLGQVVEDLSGMPFDRYLREWVFAPLRMQHSDVVRSERVRPRLATGYELGSRGLTPVVDREVVTTGAGNAYATTRDMVRYVAALLAGGAGEHGRLLRPATLSGMFEPHYRPDPRLPGMGLAFFRDTIGGHRVLGHDGIWKGFLSSMLLAPDDGIGVLAFANTGHFRPGGAPEEAADAVLRHLLGVPADTVRGDVPQDPTGWAEYCGWYTLGRGVLVDPQPRSMFGAGLQVVAGDRLRVGSRCCPGV